eukprot:TRINITY_DN2022_c2_g1_i2.p1 TRINITY_DN2022_c2_g1~~TRINITY_DN2022_c2_g1_i2.p1  ORF type:complete len:435 (-),score=105.53 TRINITY_DN2022_c2_g1_i2:983-2161(-)
MKKEKVRDRVRRVLKKYPVIDGHNDVPFTLKKMYDNDVTKFDFSANLTSVLPYAAIDSSHTDIPRLREGHVGGQFWSAYIRCNTQGKDAVERILEQVDVIYKLMEKYPDDLVLTTSSSEVERVMAEGKVASLIGIEGGHAINSNLAVLRTLYRAGARYMTLSHACNTPWVDTANIELPDSELKPQSYGLSDGFGVNVIKEMNRLGMIIDVSHVSTAAMRQVLRVSEAPVMFSHSGARAVYDHPRNVPDDVLQHLPLRDGVAMVIFYSCYLVDNCNQTNRASIKDVVNHIDHIREVAGVNHVGIGSDYNGVGLVPPGLDDVSGFPALLETLLEESRFSWSDEDLGKLTSQNILRVMKKVESVRDRLRDVENKRADNTVFQFTEESQCRSVVEL